jgi:hypothetical protein
MTTFRDRYNDRLTRGLERYRINLERLRQSAMPDGIPPGFNPMDERQEHTTLNAMDWPARLRQVGFHQTSQEYTRMLELNKRYGT